MRTMAEGSHSTLKHISAMVEGLEVCSMPESEASTIVAAEPSFDGCRLWQDWQPGVRGGRT